jgi:hypothetical protein
MKRFIAISTLLLVSTGLVAAAQNTGSNAGGSNGQGAQGASGDAKPAPPVFGSARTAAARKPKKVWTNDEIGSAGGPGGISVVGNSPPQPARPASHAGASSSLPERQIGSYRDRLRKLNGQLEATDKQISDLRNFKAENTGASGGININHHYSMTPVEDQVKALEEKKKQLLAQIDAVEDQARKSGVEPGQLR